MWQHMFFGANMIWNVLKFRALHYFITRGILLLLVNFRIWNLDREKRDYTQTKTFDLTKPGLCGQDMHFIRKNRKNETFLSVIFHHRGAVIEIQDCHMESQLLKCMSIGLVTRSYVLWIIKIELWQPRYVFFVSRTCSCCTNIEKVNCL